MPVGSGRDKRTPRARRALLRLALRAQARSGQAARHGGKPLPIFAEHGNVLEDRGTRRFVKTLPSA